MPKKPPPPQFEISDLSISKSDPRYVAAVRCVKTYWKQATSMTNLQAIAYVKYLSASNISEYLPTSSATAEPSSLMANATCHKLYPKRVAGDIPAGPWTGYLFLSSVYERLPSEYLESIKERFGSTTIQDHTDEYRRIYPAPTVPREKIPKAWNAKKMQSYNSPILVEDSTSTPSTTQSAVPGAWSIGKVIDTMSPSSRKRLGSGPDSAAKRAKADNNEMLKKVNQQAEIIQEAIESLQEKQETKLREMREAIEENKQAVTTMQGELRQFMSAVATTLRDIQERLDE